MTTFVRWNYKGEMDESVLRQIAKVYDLGNDIYNREIRVTLTDSVRGLSWRIQGRARAYLNGHPCITREGKTRDGELSVKNPTYPENYIEAHFPFKEGK